MTDDNTYKTKTSENQCKATPCRASRPGIGFLGALVAAAMGASFAVGNCSISCSDDDTPASFEERIEKKVDDNVVRRLEHLEKRLNKKITSAYSPKDPHVYKMNVLGGPEPETFVVVDGQRYFMSIDGKPVRDYLKK